jgi:benzoyl-CoA reductase/2-hydroxyglutaryl-CoA dehydratase subunit BcrC/BadD/HgdB
MHTVTHTLQSAIREFPSPLGFITAYIPEELFHAAGFTPLFIFPTSQDRGLSRATLPSFTCWIVGSALDQALAGELDGLTAMALAKTCDTTQGLADLWPWNVPGIPCLHFGMPLRLDGPVARTYLLAELRSLQQRIENLTGRTVSEDALSKSIALFNRVRSLVRHLYTRAGSSSRQDEWRSASILYERVRAAFEMPKQAYIDYLTPILEDDPDSTGDGDGHRLPRVLLVGPALGDPALFEVLDQAGVHVVGDLFDLGERYFDVDAVEGGDPLESLANRLVTLLPTPTKHHPLRTRTDYLLSLAQERRVDGVVFAREKFCDPHGFDYVQIRHALEQIGLPHLLLELEQASQSGQLRTRVEAFREMMAH